MKLVIRPAEAADFAAVADLCVAAYAPFLAGDGYGDVVGMSAHLFANGVDATAREAELKAWLDSVYA